MKKITALNAEAEKRKSGCCGQLALRWFLPQHLPLLCHRHHCGSLKGSSHVMRGEKIKTVKEVEKRRGEGGR